MSTSDEYPMEKSERIAPGWGANSAIRVIDVGFPNEFTVKLPDGSTQEMIDLSSGSCTNLIGVPNERLEEIHTNPESYRPFVNYGYFDAERERLAENLLGMSDFDGGGEVYRASTGTLAGTTAIKLAWLYQFEKGADDQRRLIIAPRGSYFGHDPCTLSAGYWSGSGSHDEGESFNSYYIPDDIAANFRHVPSPESGVPLAESVQQVIDQSEARVAALMLEPVQFVGATVPDSDYFGGVMDVAEKNDILVIADECATFGRFGSWLASRSFGLQPDIYTVGKGISNSYEKVAATIASPEVSKHIENKDIPEGVKVMFGSTLDWMPRDAAIANAVIDEVRENDLLQKGNVLAGKLKISLQSALADKSAVHVRGLGGWSTITFDQDGVAGDVRRTLMKRHGLYCYRSGSRLNLLYPLVGTASTSEDIARSVSEACSQVLE